MAILNVGVVHGTTIELERAIPELEGQRVHVVLEALDEPRLRAEQQRLLWQTWIEWGPQGPVGSGDR